MHSEQLSIAAEQKEYNSYLVLKMVIYAVHEACFIVIG